MKEKNSFKFRVWLKSIEEMVEVLEIDFYNKEVAYIWTEQISDYELEQTREVDKFKDIILMQSTGLRDKNGLEIFEGDIILSRYGDYSAVGIGKYHREYREEFHNHPIIYNPVGVYEYMFNDSTGGKLSYEFESGDAERSEVVGNIYQNHEFLEVEE